MKIRKGDLVVVTTGDDAGVIVPTGDRRPQPRKVIQVLDGGKKLLVEQGQPRLQTRQAGPSPQSARGPVVAGEAG